MASRNLFLPIYAPTFLINVADAMLIPTLPIYAQSIGASFAQVSLAVATTSLGTLLADVPVGVMMERYGRKQIMLVGTLAVAASTILMGLSPIFLLLVLMRLLSGFGHAMWGISRMGYISALVPLAERGRVLSSFGGAMRVGMFVGPALGGFIAQQFGLTTAFIVAGGLAGLGALFASMAPEVSPSQGTARRHMRWGVLPTLVRQYRRDLASAGGTQIILQMLRQTRQVVIPLYGSSVLGLEVASLGTIVSIAAAMDMSLFFPAGYIMDRLGRKCAIVPAMLLLAAGIGLMVFAQDYLGLLLASTVAAVGNGISSGAMLTLGSDLAPKEATGEFLGIWRLLGDTGAFGGPMAVGGIADVVGLPIAALSIAGVGVAGAGLVALLQRETLNTEQVAIRRPA